MINLYETRGAHITGSETHFAVYAPSAQKAYVVLTDENGIERLFFIMKKTDGVWKAQCAVEDAPLGATYRYCIKNAQGVIGYRTDPFSFSTFLNKKGQTESVVSDPDKFEWSDEEHMKALRESNPLEKPLSVYELHVDSWKKKDGKPLNFRELAHELIAYCLDMNFTHVELYGLLDNEGEWGYRVDNFFAPNKRLGSAEDFQYFVDQLHQNKIGVILDWIPAHFKASPAEVSLHNFDGTNLFGDESSKWRTKLFDYTKDETRRLLQASALYWIDKMHVDAVRVDAVSCIVTRKGKNYKPGIDFLKRLNEIIHARFPGTLMIAEASADFPKLTRPVDQGGVGFDLKWDILAGMKLRWFVMTPHQTRHLHHQHKFISYLQGVKAGERAMITHSHDEPANRVKAFAEADRPESGDTTIYKICVGNLMQKFADMRNFFAWQAFAPSRGFLLHMGDEIGQRRSWNILARDPNRNGAIQWELLGDEEPQNGLHRGLQECVRKLNFLYRENGAFWHCGEQGFIQLADHPKNNVIVYKRKAAGYKSFYILHNFSHRSWPEYRIRLPNITFALKNVFNSDSREYGGTDFYKGNPVRTNRKGEHLFSIPPLSTLVFEKLDS